MIFVFCLSFPTFSFTFSQSEVGLDCNLNLERIFKVHDLKIKYEIVQYIYKEIEKKRRFPKNSYYLNSYFELIRGFPLYSKKQCDSISSVSTGELVEVEWMSEEETNKYIEQLNCTPEKSFKEYRDFIRNTKFEKEMYLNCINIELAKGDLSKYAKDRTFNYDFHSPMQSLIPPSITKLDFLKVFKKYILNDNEEVLPDSLRVYAYLNVIARETSVSDENQ